MKVLKANCTSGNILGFSNVIMLKNPILMSSDDEVENPKQTKKRK